MNQPFVYEMDLDMCSVDFTGDWQPGAVFRAMQNASEGHCRLLHISFEELREQGLAWVMTRAHMHMDRYPVFGQRVRIKTWPGKTKHMFFPRNYAFEVDGKQVGCVTAIYVLIDIQTRKIALPSRLTVPLPVYDIPDALPFPGNVKNLDVEPTITTHQPVYTDLDMNGHVNNTRYIDWYGNLFSYERHQQSQLSDLLIHYNFEVTPHEPVSFVVREQDDITVMQGISGEQNCFAIEGKWRARA